MKELPQDPPVYTFPPELWFAKHQHARISKLAQDPEGTAGDESVIEEPDLSPAAIAKTMMAMWLTLHDRMRLPLPTAQRKFTVGEIEMFKKLEKKLGPTLMDVWRTACIYVSKDELPEDAFKNLLAAKGLTNE